VKLQMSASAIDIQTPPAGTFRTQFHHASQYFTIIHNIHPRSVAHKVKPQSSLLNN